MVNFWLLSRFHIELPAKFERVINLIIRRYDLVRPNLVISGFRTQIGWRWQKSGRLTYGWRKAQPHELPSLPSVILSSVFRFLRHLRPIAHRASLCPTQSLPAAGQRTDIQSFFTAIAAALPTLDAIGFFSDCGFFNFG
jgi:hypothetical protein